MKHFVYSKASQYRKLKSEWRQNVVLGRSNIQGLGLFANREIEPNSMVIEYIGSIIRNEVANRKENIYESQNRGIYMFRMDTDAVIDATMAGGPARYINHSCMVSLGLWVSCVVKQLERQFVLLAPTSLILMLLSFNSPTVLLRL